MQRPGWKTIEVAICVLLLSGLFCCGVMWIQQKREDARRSTCQGKLKQLWFALENYTIVNRAYPAGTMAAGQKGEYSSWIVALMTQFEQRDWYQKIQQEYDLQPSPFQPTPHSSFSLFNTAIACPSDRFHSAPHLSTRHKIEVASTSYLGISGLASHTPQGILFYDSQVRPNARMNQMTRITAKDCRATNRSAQIEDQTEVRLAFGNGLNDQLRQRDI